jgi:hypothetical protein
MTIQPHTIKTQCIACSSESSWLQHIQWKCDTSRYLHINLDNHSLSWRWAVIIHTIELIDWQMEPHSIAITVWHLTYIKLALWLELSLEINDPQKNDCCGYIYILHYLLCIVLNRILLLLLSLLYFVILDTLFYNCYGFVFIYAGVALVSLTLNLWPGESKTVCGSIMWS